jgi:hypothetical protein
VQEQCCALVLALCKIAGMVPVLISAEIVAKVRRAYHRHIVSGVVVALTAEVSSLDQGQAPLLHVMSVVPFWLGGTLVLGAAP